MTIEINFAEKDIEDFLSKPKNIEHHLGLKFIARQVKIFDFFIDILAYSLLEKCFYIIELKKDDIDAKAFTQARRYKNLMETKYLLKHKFKILLIGQNLSEELIGLVNHFDGYGNVFARRKTPFDDYYTLFGYNFENGISFCWYNKAQNEFALRIGDYINEKRAS